MFVSGLNGEVKGAAPLTSGVATMLLGHTLHVRLSRSQLQWSCCQLLCSGLLAVSCTWWFP